MFLIKNKNGEYFTGTLVLKLGENSWKMKFTQDIERAEKYSSEAAALVATIKLAETYRIDFCYEPVICMEVPEKKREHNRDTINNYLNEHPFQIPKGEQILPRDFCRPRESESMHDLRKKMYISFDFTAIPNDATSGVLRFTPDNLPTITDICKEADDNKTNGSLLIQILTMAIENKEHYPIHQLYFIYEHIESYIEKIDSKGMVNRLMEE